MEKYIPFVNRKDCCKILLKDILYLENDARRVRIMTTEGAYCQYAKLSDLEPYFREESCFFPAMKSLIVNFDYVSAMKNQIIYFNDGTEYPIGRSNYLRTKHKFVSYLRII